MRVRELFATMCLIRAFELEVAKLYRDGEIPGFVHTSLGQEAVAAGVCGSLREDDYLATTHRGHGHVLAKGADLDGMMAELFGKASGLCGGRGGSMHIADPGRGILGANAIVGAGMPLATGAGLASKLMGQGRVAVAFFGEGAVNQGTFHEALNLCAIWDLPVLFACENNFYAEFSDSRTLTRVPSVAERAAAYGVVGETVHGNDVEAVAAATGAAVERCRSGEGPALIEFETYRWHGHYEGDAQPYRPDEEASSWRERDPLEITAMRLAEDGATTEELEEVRADAATRVTVAVEAARTAAEPDPKEVFAHVYGD
ncbi:MAG: thiamine pyrophosphate-dependent dehydrogenase E1 component subunit alpha [Actinobacteria bacterium]|nr:thiamine pyrophosphate-dependent dehydrogenase E1 component subunit alpha [Actinomycetota bacterium]